MLARAVSGRSLVLSSTRAPVYSAGRRGRAARRPPRPRRDEVVDRLARARRARGRASRKPERGARSKYEMRSGAERRSCVSRIRSSGTPGRLATASRRARAPARAASSPGSRRSSSAPRTNTAIVEPALLERVDGPGVTGRARPRRRGRPRRRAARARAGPPRASRRPCGPGRRRRGRAGARARAARRAARASATCPMCGGSNDAAEEPYCHSSTSPPISTSAPRLTPAGAALPRAPAPAAASPTTR